MNKLELLHEIERHESMSCDADVNKLMAENRELVKDALRVGYRIDEVLTILKDIDYV